MKRIINGLIICGFIYALFFAACMSEKNKQAEAVKAENVIASARVAAPMLPSGVFKKTYWKKDFAPSFYADESVNGITIMAYWSDLNPSAGVYNWARIDTMCAMAASNGKMIAFNIATGAKAPSWVIERSGSIKFVEFNHVTTGSKPIPVNTLQPIIFKQSYIEDLTRFISDFGLHCRANTYWKNIVLVSCSGVSRTTEEIRLPCQDNVKIGAYTSTNATKLWAGVGYTSDTVITAFNKIATAWIIAFPKRAISYSYLNGKDFPAGDKDVFSSASVTLDQLCKSAQRSNTALFKFTSLSNGDLYSKKMLYIDSFGGAKGAQLAESIYSTLALKDSAELIGALDLAVAQGLIFTELDYTTAERFPNIISRYNKIIK